MLLLKLHLLNLQYHAPTRNASSDERYVSSHVLLARLNVARRAHLSATYYHSETSHAPFLDLRLRKKVHHLVLPLEGKGGYSNPAWRLRAEETQQCFVRRHLQQRDARRM